MKNLLLFLAFCCLAATAQATVLLVNNNNPNPGQYPNVDAAIAVANSGDTIYIAGSPFTYPNFTVSKNNLTFIGPGARSPRVLGQDADIICVTLNDNIDSLKVMGLVFNYFNYNCQSGFIASNVDNVTLERCWIGEWLYIWSNSNNWVVRNCIFNGSGINAGNTPGRSNIIISHNLFRFRNSRIDSFGGNNTGIFISNNVFCQTENCCWSNSLQGEFQNCLVVNNIFYGRPVWGIGTASNNIFSDNISFSINGSPTDFPGGNNQSANNIINQDPLFTNFPANGGTYFEPSLHDLTLQAGSPAHNEGTDGTDMGLYGSGNIFSETGEPALPIIQNITIGNPAVQSGTNLNVTVEARNADPDQD